MANRHAKDPMKELKDKLQDTMQQLNTVTADKRILEEQLAETEAIRLEWEQKFHSLSQFKYQVQGQQQGLIAQEQQRYEEMEKKNLEEIRKLNFELSVTFLIELKQYEFLQEQQKNQRQANSLEEKDEIIQKFIIKLRDTPGAQNLKEFMEDIEEFKEDRVANVHQLQKQVHIFFSFLILKKQAQIQELNLQIESLVIQNRVLARMANVEDDFIIDVTEIKAAEEKKAQDYKVQVRYLEQEIEELEAERQKLRHQLRIASTLYSQAPGERYQGLNKDQLFLLDQYALNLRNGQNQIPMNDRSKELEEENKELKIQLKTLEKFNYGATHQNEKQFIGSQSQLKMGGTQLNESRVELLEKQNQDIKNYINKLIETMNQQQQGGGTQQQFNFGSTGGGQHTQLTLPPMVQGGPMGNLDYGYSYRFQTKMPIDFQDYYQENDEFMKGVQIKQEVAFLQLQNLETMKLLELKEMEYEGLVSDSKFLKDELRTCLQVQDEMIKRFRNEKIAFNQKIQELAEEKQNLAELNEEKDRKLKAYDEEITRIESKNENEYEIKLANNAKRIAQMDVNLLRLSRKYDCLLARERSLQAQYDNIHKEYGEKMGEYQQGLNEAIWKKKKATEHLRILMSKVENSVPIDDKKYQESEISDLRFQVAQMKQKNSDLSLKLSQKDSYQRQVFEKDEELKQKEDELLEIELELEIMKDRLIRLDPVYRKYQEVFSKLAEQINFRNMSPLQVFQLIDTDGNGHINKEEFSKAMREMQIDIKSDDEDTLFLFLDLDGSGEIEYNEFTLKLKRSGVKIKKKEEELIYNIHSVIKSLGYSYRDAFDAFDTNKDQLITKQDMKQAFKQQDISDADLDYFIRIADTDHDKAITFEEFEKLFKDIIQDHHSHQQSQKHQLEWQYALLVTLNEEMQKAGWKLIDLFKEIDIDQNDKIDYQEFSKLFRDMTLDIEENELKGLFNQIDNNKNNYISYDEFQKAIREALREQERLRRQQLLDQRTEYFHKQYAERQKDENYQKELENQPGISETSRLQMKVKTMEVRQSQQQKWMENYRRQLDSKDRSLDEYMNRIQELENAEIKNAKEYSEISSKYRELKYKSERGISTIEAQHLNSIIDKLQIENRDLRSAMDTFKQLYESSTHQIQLLKYTLDRQNDEAQSNRNTKEIILNKQSESDEKAIIGKVMHEMLMVKQSAAETNRK